RLPDYMVPGAWAVVPALPLSANGKVDRRALAATAAHAARRPAYRALLTPLEELLTGLWHELLQVPRAGLDDGFFALGGHSLLGTRVLSRGGGACGRELPLSSLL